MVSNCTCSGRDYTIAADCPVHGFMHIPYPPAPTRTVCTTTSNTVQLNCGHCGTWLQSPTEECPNCEHCKTCDDRGNIETLVFGIGPRKETTWCPDCAEGQVWKELLDE